MEGIDPMELGRSLGALKAQNEAILQRLEEGADRMAEMDGEIVKLRTEMARAKGAGWVVIGIVSALAGLVGLKVGISVNH